MSQVSTTLRTVNVEKLHRTGFNQFNEKGLTLKELTLQKWGLDWHNTKTTLNRNKQTGRKPESGRQIRKLDLRMQ